MRKTSNYRQLINDSLVTGIAGSTLGAMAHGSLKDREALLASMATHGLAGAAIPSILAAYNSYMKPEIGKYKHIADGFPLFSSALGATGGALLGGSLGSTAIGAGLGGLIGGLMVPHIDKHHNRLQKEKPQLHSEMRRIANV